MREYARCGTCIKVRGQPRYQFSQLRCLRQALLFIPVPEPDWLCCQLPEIIWLYIPALHRSTQITEASLALLPSWELKPRTPHLHGKHIAHWSVFQASNFLINFWYRLFGFCFSHWYAFEVVISPFYMFGFTVVSLSWLDISIPQWSLV